MTWQVSMTCHLAQHSPFSPHFWFDVSGCKLETSLILEILHHFQVLAEGVLEVGDTQWGAEGGLSGDWEGQAIESASLWAPPPCMNRPPHSAPGLTTCSR